MKEMLGGCCVCSDESGWDENPLVYCDGHQCTVAVHKACYGIVQVPTGPWFCRKCESQERQARVRCELCPSRDGALKRTDSQGWAHVVCSLYIPEVRFGDVKTMEPIVLQFVPADRYHKSCYICEERGKPSKSKVGACMQCNKPGCKQYFHVTCAQSAGLLCEEAGKLGDNVKFCGYCKYHYNRIKEDDNIKTIPAFKPISVESESSLDKRGPSSSSSSSTNHHHVHHQSHPPHHSTDPGRPPKKKQKFFASSTIASTSQHPATSSSTHSDHDKKKRKPSSASKEKETTKHASTLSGTAKTTSLKEKPRPFTLSCSSSSSSSSSSDDSSSSTSVENSPRASPMPFKQAFASGAFEKDPAGRSSKLVRPKQAFDSDTDDEVIRPTKKNKPTDRFERSGKTERPEKLDRLEKLDKHDKTDKHDKPDKHDKLDKPDKQDKPDKHDKLDKHDKPEKKRIRKTSLSKSSKEKERISKEKEKDFTKKLKKKRDEFEDEFDRVFAAKTVDTRPDPVLPKQHLPNGSIEKSIAEPSEKAKGTDQSEKSEKGEKADKSEKMERIEKSEKPGRFEKLLKPAKTDKGEKSVKQDRLEKSGKPDKSEKLDRLDRPERMEKPDKVEKQDILVKQIAAEKPDHRLEKAEKPSRPEKQETPDIPSIPEKPTHQEVVQPLPLESIAPSPVAVPTEPEPAPMQERQPTPDLIPPEPLPASVLPTVSNNFVIPSVRRLPPLAPEYKDPDPPKTLEQLLERQWTQTAQFLLDQPQHFDIASLLSCLSQLKTDNEKLEDRMRQLLNRRDHLIAVNSRLSLPLNGLTQPVASGFPVGGSAGVGLQSLAQLMPGLNPATSAAISAASSGLNGVQPFFVGQNLLQANGLVAGVPSAAAQAKHATSNGNGAYYELNNNSCAADGKPTTTVGVPGVGSTGTPPSNAGYSFPGKLLPNLSQFGLSGVPTSSIAYAPADGAAASIGGGGIQSMSGGVPLTSTSLFQSLLQQSGQFALGQPPAPAGLRGHSKR